MAAGDIYQITGGLKGRKAVAFLGGDVNDGIQIDAFGAGRITANDTKGTFTAWINVPDITGTYAILGCGDASAVEYFYIAVVAGEIQCKAALAGPDVAFDLISSDAVIKPHNWHHITFVQDAVQPRMYVDGVRLTLTETDVTERSYWFEDFTLIDGAHIGAADSIAGDAALTLEFKGGISDVKYWNTDLTDAQIVDDFNGLANTTSLIAHWDMDGDYIESVTGYNGTAVGDIILTNNYCEFTSRLRNTLAVAPLVADDITFAADNETGYAIIVKAA